MPRGDVTRVLDRGQLGLETTAGTIAPALSAVGALGFDAQPAGSQGIVNTMGYFVATGSYPNERYANIKVSGTMCYNALTYVYESLLGKTVPSGGGTAKTRLYLPSPIRAADIQTYTLEVGNSRRARRAAYMYFKESQFEFSRKMTKYDGVAEAQALNEAAQLSTSAVQTVTITGTATGGSFTLTFNAITTGAIAYNSTAAAVQTIMDTAFGQGQFIVAGGPLPGTPMTFTFTGDYGQQTVAIMTANSALLTGTTPVAVPATTTPGVTATAIPVVPIQPSTIDCWVDTSWATLGTTQLTRGFNLKYTLGDRTAPVWAMRSSVAGFVSHIANDLKATGSVLVGIGDPSIDLMLTALESGTKQFLRMKSTGPAIPGGGNYSHQVDLCITAGNPYKVGDQDKVLAYEFPFEIAFDPTSGNFMQVQLINALATL